MNKQPGKHSNLEPDLSVQEQRRFWSEVGKDLVRKSHDPIDETAKQIIGVSTILVGLYFNAIAFSKLQGKVQDWWTLTIYLAPIAMLLVSLIASLNVFHPNRYSHNINSSEASKEVFEDALKRKWISLQVASLFLILSIIALIITVSIYLRG